MISVRTLCIAAAIASCLASVHAIEDVQATQQDTEPTTTEAQRRLRGQTFGFGRGYGGYNGGGGGGFNWGGGGGATGGYFGGGGISWGGGAGGAGGAGGGASGGYNGGFNWGGGAGGGANGGGYGGLSQWLSGLTWGGYRPGNVPQPQPQPSRNQSRPRLRLLFPVRAKVLQPQLQSLRLQCRPGAGSRPEAKPQWRQQRRR
ncbi:hypothetical protein PINS_up012365 [Pythium insidiosum]|nr:hypothetical protein PINS_up012365 [Pythium insidiosum]